MERLSEKWRQANYARAAARAVLEDEPKEFTRKPHAVKLALENLLVATDELCEALDRRLTVDVRALLSDEED